MIKTNGFTLVELLVVVAIIAIVTAVAIPSYSTYVERTRRATGQADLMELAQWMERRYTNNYDYSDGSGGAPTLPFTTSPQGSGSTYYNFSVSSITTNSFTLLATPTGPQANDPCGNLTVNDAGQKGSGGTDCW